MAQSVKKLTDKTDDLGPILRNHMTEGENCSLTAIPFL